MTRKKMVETGSNWDKLSRQWKQLSGLAKKQWGKLTEDELMEINGNREILAGKVKERYGIAKEDANKQIDEWAASKKRVLHVDDVWEIRSLVRAILTFHGYIIMEAADGASAVVIAAQELPDIILMDYQLPDMNGVETTKQIRRTQPSVRVIAVTATDRAQDYEEIMASGGCDDYLLKPFTPKQLVEIVTRYIQPAAHIQSSVLSMQAARRVIAGGHCQQIDQSRR